MYYVSIYIYNIQTCLVSRMFGAFCAEIVLGGFLNWSSAMQRRGDSLV